MLNKELKAIEAWQGPRLSGRVTHVIGLLIESNGPNTFIGELCMIYGKNGCVVLGQVVGFKGQQVLLMPFGEITYVAPGSEVYPTGRTHQIGVDHSLCGRILDGLGHPIDGKGVIYAKKSYPVIWAPPAPLSRSAIGKPLVCGIRAIDGLCTLGVGQRVGIFSGPGMGKSTLLAMLARQAAADINVIALIGERGREVREFIDKELGEEGLARSVVIVVTSDQTALLKTIGAHVATTIAEYFRNLGKNVLLLMDSISRYAFAWREIGLTIGEPPTTKGYTPSVFAALPRLLERAGNNEKGSMTGVYTILSEEEGSDPLSDQIRSLLDGHIYLSKELANANHFPAIDVLNSLSRVMAKITSKKHYTCAAALRLLLSTYKQGQDLIQAGAYTPSVNPKLDEAIGKMDRINRFLQQETNRVTSFDEMLNTLESIV